MTTNNTPDRYISSIEIGMQQRTESDALKLYRSSFLESFRCFGGDPCNEGYLREVQAHFFDRIEILEFMEWMDSTLEGKPADAKERVYDKAAKYFDYWHDNGGYTDSQQIHAKVCLKNRKDALKGKLAMKE